MPPENVETASTRMAPSPSAETMLRERGALVDRNTSEAGIDGPEIADAAEESIDGERGDAPRINNIVRVDGTAVVDAAAKCVPVLDKNAGVGNGDDGTTVANTTGECEELDDVNAVVS
jgi:hypothetical protein